MTVGPVGIGRCATKKPGCLYEFDSSVGDIHSGDIMDIIRDSIPKPFQFPKIGQVSSGFYQYDQYSDESES